MFLDCETCKQKCSLRSKFNCRKEEDIFKDEFKIAESTQTKSHLLSALCLIVSH